MFQPSPRGSDSGLRNVDAFECHLQRFHVRCHLKRGGPIDQFVVDGIGRRILQDQLAVNDQREQLTHGEQPVGVLDLLRCRGGDVTRGNVVMFFQVLQQADVVVVGAVLVQGEIDRERFFRVHPGILE